MAAWREARQQPCDSTVRRGVFTIENASGLSLAKIHGCVKVRGDQVRVRINLAFSVLLTENSHCTGALYQGFLVFSEHCTRLVVESEIRMMAAG
jgi:hypothetical protein